MLLRITVKMEPNCFSLSLIHQHGLGGGSRPSGSRTEADDKRDSNTVWYELCHKTWVRGEWEGVQLMNNPSSWGKLCLEWGPGVDFKWLFKSRCLTKEATVHSETKIPVWFFIFEKETAAYVHCGSSLKWLLTCKCSACTRVAHAGPQRAARLIDLRRCHESHYATAHVIHVALSPYNELECQCKWAGRGPNCCLSVVAALNEVKGTHSTSIDASINAEDWWNKQSRTKKKANCKSTAKRTLSTYAHKTNTDHTSS